MNSDYKERQRKSYTIMRMIYDLTMAILLLGMAIVMLFAEKLNVDRFIVIDTSFRYMFGAICLLYGSFRLYRGIKKDY